MGTFEDQLFADLMAEHGSALQDVQRPAAAPRSRARPAWMTAGALATAGAVAGGLVLFGGGGPAYAVTQHADGTVTITVDRLSGVAGADAALHALGLSVAAVPVRAGCPSVSSLPRDTGAHQPANVGASTGADGSVTVDVHSIPSGDTALVSFAAAADGRLTGSMQLIKGKAPSCVSPPTPSDGGSTSSNQEPPSSGAGTHKGS